MVKRASGSNLRSPSFCRTVGADCRIFRLRLTAFASGNSFRLCMKKLIISVLLTAVVSVAGCAGSANKTVQKPRKIAVQAYSLNKFTLEESLQKLKPLGITAIECYPGQRLSAKYPNAKVGPTLNAEERAYMKKIIADAGMTMPSFGVVNVRALDFSDIEPLFKFAKEMGAKRILTESPVYFWKALDQAAEKYGITVCIHHHATNGAPYWDTDYFKRHAKGFKHIKYNPDPGHWSRSGIDPVKSLREVDGYIAGIHFKDQREFGNIKNQPAPFGKGVLDVKGMLAELDRQGFGGYYVIEYEDKWLDNIPEIKECAEYLRKN